MSLSDLSATSLAILAGDDGLIDVNGLSQFGTKGGHVRSFERSFRRQRGPRGVSCDLHCFLLLNSFVAKGFFNSGEYLDHRGCG